MTSSVEELVGTRQGIEEIGSKPWVTLVAIGYYAGECLGCSKLPSTTSFEWLVK
jgi:hypothetical protein